MKSLLHTGTWIALALCTSSAMALDLDEVKRPIDEFAVSSSESDLTTFQTLYERKQQEGSFKLGKALIAIGRTDLAGVSLPLTSLTAGTVEAPMGGWFTENPGEQPHVFGPATANGSEYSGSSYEQPLTAKSPSSLRSMVMGNMAQSSRSNSTRITSSHVTRVSFRQ